jgi:4-alpha-glucanotransferase
MSFEQSDQLRHLARLFGIEAVYWDGLGIHRVAPVDSVLAALRSLGAPVHSLADVDNAILERTGEQVSRLIEPVNVAWEGQSTRVPIRLPENLSHCQVKVVVRLEQGGEIEFEVDLQDLEEVGRQAFGGTFFQQRVVRLPEGLPLGYHQLFIEISYTQAEALLIVAPEKAFVPHSEASWGVFLPLYSLRSEQGWGSGDFSDLRTLAQWVASLGGSFVGTLPLFACFLDEPLDPSPYAPISRLFWNEFYVDPTRSPQWSRCSSARELFSSEAFQKELSEFRDAQLVDYRRQMGQKRCVMEHLSEQFFVSERGESESFRSFLEEKPQIEKYAAFRAIQEQLRESWRMWPEHLRHLDPASEECSERVRRYHLYVQWLAHEQVSDLLDPGQNSGVGLYLDVPLGTHPDGFDMFLEAGTFAEGVSGGAPPDGFFTRGQNWGFQPLHPEASRDHHHSYLRLVLQQAMAHCALLRIDHVMGLHRLYWVPEGFSAEEGVYVEYPAEELYAILALESQRQQCAVVGEDLGTVLDNVRKQMAHHHFHRMHVGQFEVAAGSQPPVNEPETEFFVASLNTHDTPTFAAFLNGLDLEQRRQMELLTEEGFQAEAAGRNTIRMALAQYFAETDEENADRVAEQILQRWIAFLAKSRARYVMINLEDLWLEPEPQNLPGTGDERPNWRRKARLRFEELREDPQVLDTLRKVAEQRPRE